MKVDKKLIFHIVLGLALLFTLVNIFSAAAATSQIFAYNVSEATAQVSDHYISFIKPLALIGTLALCAAFIFSILTVFVSDKKLFKFAAVAIQLAAALILLVFIFLAKTQIPHVSITSYPHKISFINYEYSNSVQSMFVTLFAMAFVLLTTTVFSIFYKDKTESD